MPFEATWMDLEITTLSKLERERQIPYDITYMQNITYDTNEPTHETETESENRLVVAKGEGGRGDLEFGDNR